jgi:hypothetical protein
VKRRHNRHRPFGGTVAQLHRGGNMREVVRRWFGDSELGRRVVAALREQRVDGRGRTLAERRKVAAVQRRMLKLVFLVLSETDAVGGVARGPRLWQGECDREHRPRACGPVGGPHPRRGLALRVGRSTRQVQRYLEAFEHAGVWRRRQGEGPETSDRDKSALSGQPYMQVVWSTALPVAVKLRLAQWGQHPPAQGFEAPQRPPAIPGPSRPLPVPEPVAASPPSFADLIQRFARP